MKKPYNTIIYTNLEGYDLFYNLFYFEKGKPEKKVAFSESQFHNYESLTNHEFNTSTLTLSSMAHDNRIILKKNYHRIYSESDPYGEENWDI